MEFINNTRMRATFTVGLDSQGHEWLVTVVKGTFRIPNDGEVIRLSDEQQPFVFADEFNGDPSSSAPVHEVDFALRKNRCDILLNGAAYAPNGRPVSRVTVGIAVDRWTKTFDVVGTRRWVSGVTGFKATAPDEFVRLPISYEVAFGGIDARHEDAERHVTYRLNPVGRGFHRHLKASWVEGSPLPNTEEIGREVQTPDGTYRPMAFGPVGRGWEPRIGFAGTYGQKWIDEEFPFLPADFDERYYQTAPDDQQIPITSGEQTVTLLNLTPEGRRTFRIPAFKSAIEIHPRAGAKETSPLTLDTVLLEPDDSRVCLIWRHSRLLKRDIFEIRDVIVGSGSKPFPLRLMPAETQDVPS